MIIYPCFLAHSKLLQDLPGKNSSNHKFNFLSYSNNKHTTFKNKKINAEFLLALLYLSLWLVKALRLSATPALWRSDRRCADNRPPHDVANFKYDLSGFLLVEEKGIRRENHRGVIKKLRKVASDMIASLTHCHWDSNPKPQGWMPSDQSTRPPRHPPITRL